MNTPDAIENYMGDFVRHLGAPAGRRRRILAETEGHLRDVTDALVAGGASVAAAQLEAIDRYGSPEAAAAAFGTTPAGRAWRQIVRLRGRLFGNRSPAPAPSPVPDEDRHPGPAPMCDVCGREVGPADSVVAELSAVGHIESPLTIVVHRTCFDMGEAILALRGMPVTAVQAPIPSHP